MKIVGLVGGVASGKSQVATALARYGAVVLDGDKTGHEVLTWPEVQNALRDRWGDDVFHADGAVDRSAVAKRVFGNTPEHRRELQFLNSVVHPGIRRLLRQQIDEAKAAGVKCVVLDAALLFEAGWDTLCNAIIFVDASEPVRLARALKRGWNAEQFAAREASQLPLAEKRRRSTHIIPNDGQIAAVEDWVKSFYELDDTGA